MNEQDSVEQERKRKREYMRAWYARKKKREYLAKWRAGRKAKLTQTREYTVNGSVSQEVQTLVTLDNQITELTAQRDTIVTALLSRYQPKEV